MTFIDRVRRIARTWTINTVNSAVYLFSGGRRTLHEGRFVGWRGTWSNWSRTYDCQPQGFESPASEEELCRLVKSSDKLRVVGGGHTFNASPLTNGTLLSLDRYNRILSVDRERNVVRVQAGIRLRDFTDQLLALGLALPVQGSTNAQSLGGLVATDLHGTGRDHGFLSEQVLSVRVVDASGAARTFQRGAPEFHAVFGAIGTCGLVTELEVQCVPAFNLEKSIHIVDRRWAEANIDRLLAENDHVSFYYIGGIDTENVRMNVWNRTDKPVSTLLHARTMGLELLDMLLSGYLMGVARVLDLSAVFASLGLWVLKLFQHETVAVHPSGSGFSRRLYYHHDEIEFGVPYDVHQQCLDAVRALMKERDFVSIIEVRFTPDASRATIGPGVGRRTCFIELAPSLSVDDTAIFAEVEQLFLKYGGQVHLGKATRANGATLAKMYGPRWSAFRAVQRKQDPWGKFVNDFVARLFEGAQVAQERPAPTQGEQERLAG